MADCDGYTLTIPDLTCASDLSVWATNLANAMQAAIDHVVACVNEYEYPQCDICVIKDDLVDCPLDCNMIDFTGITYGDEAGVCQLPHPSGGYEMRVGTGITSEAFAQDSGWKNVAIGFAEEFDTECVYVSVQITAAHANPFTTNGQKLGMQHSPIVQQDSITKAGFIVHFHSDEGHEELGETLYVTFRYAAWGR